MHLNIHLISCNHFLFPLLTFLFSFSLHQGPLLYAVILAAVNHLNLRYPMDVSFLFSLTACMSLLLYICTLFLSIQYRGDFGLIADADETAGDIPAVTKPSYEDNNRKNSYGNMNRKVNDNHNESVSTSRGILDVPLTDLSLLFSSILDIFEIHS